VGLLGTAVRTSRHITVAALVGAALAASAAAQNDSAGWTHQRAERAVLTRTWPDHRIVVGASCVALSGRVAGSAGVIGSRFSCLSNIFARPAGVSPTRWDEIGTAMRTRDLPRLYALLGLSANPTSTQVNAAAARAGLSHSYPVAVGLKVTSAGRSSVERPAIPARAFTASVRARRALLEATPDIEAYKATYGTYAGATLSRLRVIDKSMNMNVRIVAANRDSYCAEIGSGDTAWFVRGPTAAPALGGC
jgi:hypothetical protein